MARTTMVFAGSGLLLGALGAVGWHFQPVFAALGPPRVLDQLPRALVGLPEGDPRRYSGAISSSALSWWHELSWVPSAALLALGGLVGAGTGALLTRKQRHRSPGGPAHRAGTTVLAAAALGLVLGVGSAVAWHWDPQASAGLWNGLWFWPVDLLYPAAGVLIAVATAAAVTLSQDGRGTDV